MHARLLIKMVIVLAALLFMVLMGMSNVHEAQFKMTKLGWDFKVDAAIMYFIFFGVGLLTGAVLAAGGGKSSSSSKSSK